MNVVITGASQGIGFAIAEIFANAGYTLCLCSKTKANIAAAGNSLAAKYPHATIHFTHADLSKKEQCTQFANWCLEKGMPTILINNAGFFAPGNIQDEGEGALEQQMAVNLYSAYHTTRALLPAMLKMGKGHIFNICSIASLNAYAQGGSYSISKFALLGFSKNLRLELKDKGIKVTAVCPGAVYTNSWAGSGVDPKRIMESEDIAKMVFAAAHLSPQAVVEDIVMRPQLGDL
ncbi:MAG: SDR family oxidoreductase [Chitinophagia bacterium]|jgi:short-subunit dehydrogenase|nr:SDR family oxidoreductase [Chitinophagia bacterium]